LITQFGPEMKREGLSTAGQDQLHGGINFGLVLAATKRAVRRTHLDPSDDNATRPFFGSLWFTSGACDFRSKTIHLP
jgi:hypothetical protein